MTKVWSELKWAKVKELKNKIKIYESKEGKESIESMPTPIEK